MNLNCQFFTLILISFNMLTRAKLDSQQNFNYENHNIRLLEALFPNAIIDVNAISLTSSNFVLAWTESGPIVKFRIYELLGQAKTSEIIVETNAQSPIMATLTDGGFVMVYVAGGGLNSKIQRFNSDGSIRGTSIPLTGTGYDVAGLYGSGGFVVVNVVGGNNLNMEIHENAAGIRLASTFVTSDIGGMVPGVTGLADGGYAIVYSKNSNGNVKLIAYDFNGNFVNMADDIGIVPAFFPNVVQVSDGGIIVIMLLSTYIAGRRIELNMALGSIFTISLDVNYPINNIMIDSLNSGGYLAAWIDSSTIKALGQRVNGANNVLLGNYAQQEICIPTLFATFPCELDNGEYLITYIDQNGIGSVGRFRGTDDSQLPFCLTCNTCPDVSDYQAESDGTCNINLSWFTYMILILSLIARYLVAISIIGTQILQPSASAGVFRLQAMNLILYLRYLDVYYPPQVKGLFLNDGHAGASLSFADPRNIDESKDNYEPPWNFRAYDIFGIFLGNAWMILIKGASLVIAGLVVRSISKGISEKNKKIVMILTDFMNWNYPLTYFLTSVMDISMYSVVEDRSVQFASSRWILSIISLFLSSCCLIGTLMILKKIALLGKRISELKKEGVDEMNPKLSQCKVLHADFRTKCLPQIMCLPILTVRCFFFGIIVGSLTFAPLTQMVLLIGFNFIIFGYLIKYWPYKLNFRNIELIFYEAILFAINVCVLSIYFITDKASGRNENESLKKHAERIGNIILGFNTILLISIIVFTCLGVASILRDKLNALKEKKTKSKVSPLKLEIPHVENSSHSKRSFLEVTIGKNESDESQKRKWSIWTD